ncbi:Hypothetical predicted protein [Paramuricea clavata]|uniref:Uncharacterized protein n=1 Tax=Paramuricea clavata TaxID=317549 RepID=A0A7D9D6J5_PARCT|nr:Hypothetical predicted protein [Paramuricea clavata]
MWNFTVRAVMKPDITGIDALSAKSMDLTEQRPIKDLKAEDFFLDSYPDLKELLQNRYDAYLIEALHMVIHELDVTYAEFKEMTESDFDSYVEE